VNHEHETHLRAYFKVYDPDWEAIINEQEKDGGSVMDREFVLAEAINDE